MTLAYAKQLDLQIGQINVGAQKMDGLFLETFEKVIVNFRVIVKLDRVRFF